MAISNKKSVIHVLHVDDDSSMLEISKQILMDIDNFEIDHACCVEEAFKKLAVCNYDAVISDYEMPQKDGLQFLKELRNLNNEIPFILFTGKGREEVAIKALNQGANGYFNKQGSPETVYGELAYGIRTSFEHKKADEILRKNQAELNAIVTNAPLGIATSDSNMRFRSANEAFCRIVGYKEDELQKRSFRDITYPEDVEVSNKEMKELICGNIPYFSQEKRYVRKDGNIIDGKVTVSAIRDSDGKPVLFVAELEDITLQKQAEAELRGTFEVLERVGEGVDAGLAVIGKDYRVIWANKLLMNLGVAPNKKCYQTFNHSENVCVDCGVKKIFEQNVSLDIHEYKTINSQGETIWVELRVTPLKDKDGNVTAALELAVPITERKKTEEKLQQDHERLKKTEQIAHIGYWDWNIQSGALVWSEEHYRIFRLPLEAVPKIDNFLANIHPDDVGFVRNSIEDAFKGKPYTIDFRIIHLDGTERMLHGTGEVIYDLEGKPTRMFGTVQDITERKKAEELRKVLERKVNDYSKHLKCMVDLRTVQLKDANERLVKSERLAAIGELAGMVGHDLRNPLAGIKNAVYYLKKKGTDISETKSKEMLEIIDKAIGHSDSIINDLLDYSREMHLELKKYVANVLVNEAIEMIKVPDRIEIINNIQEEIWIWVNADKMMRVFINFINNGIDAIPEKGTITITSCQTRNYMKIKFSDTGKGIPEETLKKIFTPLFTTKAQGMGFGLAICKRIVEAHGGTITVKTALNKGTIFTIALPLRNS